MGRRESGSAGRLLGHRGTKIAAGDVQNPRFPGGHNRYAYAMNNPLNAGDPGGFAYADRGIVVW